MAEVRQTDAYDSWFRRLRDRRAKARILIRINRLALGNPGDARAVVGGDKRTRRQDIERARDLAQALAEGEDR